jgi:NhaP-type Na+/H+ or K+/H+ antiporter
MPTLAITNFNIVLSVLGGFISLFGLVSYLLKENFYLSEALISLLAGVIVSPSAANLIRPLEYTSDNPAPST